MSDKEKVLLPLFDDFLLYIKTQNYSEETVYNYERDLETFNQYLSNLPDASPTSFKRVNKMVINQYKAYLASQDRLTSIKKEKGVVKLSSYSMNRMLSSLRSYLKYLVDVDYPIPVSAEAVKLVKTEKKHAKVAEFDQLVKLIEAPLVLEKDKKLV